jgi:deoxycytidine triphosphate deaminase
MKDNTFTINEEDKLHRGSEPVKIDKDDNYYLEVGTYEIIMAGLINLGPEEAGFVITRSTLNRNGLFITSGLYDSGYNGVMAGALHVTGGDAIIKKGTRVAQFLLFKAESLMQYDGDYGVGKEHDNKYGTFYDKEGDTQPPYYFANGHSDWELKDGVYAEKKEEE